MQRTVGESILTGARFAFSSATAWRRYRTSLACLRSAPLRDAPRPSAWTIAPTKVLVPRARSEQQAEQQAAKRNAGLDREEGLGTERRVAGAVQARRNRRPLALRRQAHADSREHVDEPAAAFGRLLRHEHGLAVRGRPS